MIDSRGLNQYRSLFWLLGLGVLLLFGCGGGATSPAPPGPDPATPQLMLGWWDGVVTDPDFDRQSALQRERGFNTLVVTIGDLTESASTPAFYPVPRDPERYYPEHAASDLARDYLRTKVSPTGIGVWVELPLSEIWHITPDKLGRDWEPNDFVPIQAYVETLQGDAEVSPKIAGWFLFDEPSLASKRWATPALLTAVAHAVRIVSSKPIMLNLQDCIFQDCGNASTGVVHPIDPTLFRDAADRFTFDAYPYHRSEATDPVAVLNQFAELHRLMAPKPTTFWAQAFGELDYPAVPVKGSQGPQQRHPLRFPAPDEARFQAWASLAVGSDGLFWFSQDWIPDPLIGSEYGPIAREVTQYRDLVLGTGTSELPGVSVAIDPPDCAPGGGNCLPIQAHVRQRTRNGETFVFAYNPSPTPRTLTFHLPGNWKSAEIIDPFSSRGTVAVSAGSLVMPLAACRVEIWQLK